MEINSIKNEISLTLEQFIGFATDFSRRVVPHYPSTVDEGKKTK